jgi:hypothetical protein
MDWSHEGVLVRTLRRAPTASTKRCISAADWAGADAVRKTAERSCAVALVDAMRFIKRQRHVFTAFRAVAPSELVQDGAGDHGSRLFRCQGHRP